MCRMLTVDPAHRLTAHEVLDHPWITVSHRGKLVWQELENLLRSFVWHTAVKTLRLEESYQHFKRYLCRENMYMVYLDAWPFLRFRMYNVYSSPHSVRYAGQSSGVQSREYENFVSCDIMEKEIWE